MAGVWTHRGWERLGRHALRWWAPWTLALWTAGCALGGAPGPAPVPARPTLASGTRTANATPAAEPARYVTTTLLRGGHADDLAFDAEGHVLFSDIVAGTINRLNGDGSVTVLLRGVAGAEGMVALADGTLLVAEQRTNRILRLAPGAAQATPLRTLPCPAPPASCAEGVDNIVRDPTDGSVIVPDSPTGDVYRMPADGSRLTLLASGFGRPVGAAVDGQGTIYVADEGGAIWRVSATGAGKARVGGAFGVPDDVALDPLGNLVVVALGADAHALYRLDPRTGVRQTLATDFASPQGLLVDARGDIYVADESGGRIVELAPA